MSDPIVGIDLGTSNTVVAYAEAAGQVRVLADEAGYKIHPSVVSFHPNGGVAVGAPAKQRKVIDPRNTVYSVKRLIGRHYDSPEVQIAKQRMPYQIKEGAKHAPVIATRAGEYAVPEISAIVLDHMRGVATAALGTPVTRAVVTVPASFNDAQRSATATAGSIAGLTVVRVLNEPTAAALAYGHSRQLHQTIAVYDFGGGTFDITILKLADQVYEVLGTAGDTFLGGDDLDERLVDRMVEKFLAENRLDLRTNEVAMMRLRAVAEQTKIELSRRTRAVVRVDEIAYGASGKSLDLQIEITRDEFVRHIADIVDRTFPVCQEAMRYAQLATTAIDDIVLVGGTTKIPYVRDQVSKFFAKAPRTDVSPEDAVALGAGLQATALERILKRKPSSRLASVPDAAFDEPDTQTERRIAQEDSLAGGALESSTVTAAEPLEATGAQPDPQTPARKRQTSGYTDSPRHGERPVERGQQIDRVDDKRTAIGRLQRPSTAVPTRTLTGAAVASEAPRADARPVDAPVLPPIPPRSTLVSAPPRPPAPPPVAAPPIRPPVPPPPVPAMSDALTLMLDSEPEPTRQPVASPHAQTLMLEPEPLPSPASTARGFAPPQTYPIQSAVTAAPPIAPVVLDVTPRGLGIGTVAGFCEELIRRNSRVPTETRKLFTTSRDGQHTVHIVVVQGESRRMHANVVIGDLTLSDLPPRPRGETSIEVTFLLDASGILQVRARDAQTGREQRASLDVVGAMPQGEVDASRERLTALRR